MQAAGKPDSLAHANWADKANRAIDMAIGDFRKYFNTIAPFSEFANL